MKEWDTTEAKAEIRYADSKCGTLLTVSLGSLALVGGILGSGDVDLPGLVMIPALIGLAALTGASMVLVLAVRPYLRGASDPDNVEVLLAHLSGIALRKHRFVRAATSLLLLAMPALAVTAVAGVLR